MTKKLILITVAALGLLYSEASLAKVCRLGDLSCDTNGFYGVGEGECDSSYKTCANPRAGATFCYAGDEAKYKDNDCCSTLVANEGYQECSIDDALVGYGKSCKGAADNITYWQYCGCSYGFVEVDGTNDPDDKALLDGNGDPIVNLDGNLVPYEARCAWDSKLYGGKCRFSQCNTDRRFFFENTGEYCKYRQETRCGGFGCMQVYDCNHDELNTGKEYYRNDSAQLAGGWDNFIPYLSEDQMTNEKDASGTVQLIKALNTTGNGLVTEDYNLTNKIVCSYAQSDGSGNDTGNGLNCNDVPNYCYLWTGCNNVRKWYSNHVNEGVIYDSEEAYLKWMEIVENQKGYNYSAQYVKNNPYHDAFYADVNPGYGTYTKNGNTYDAVNNSSCIKGIGCRITSANNGCTYITTNCHQDDAQHQCWKKISCSEENRFYSSFINASNVDNKTGKQELYLSSLNAPYWDEFYTGLQDKEIYPACLYEINECNDASGCYKKIGCETNFEDIRDHEEIENDWYPWFGDIRALCNDATRCYRATSCEPSVGAYSSRPNTSFFVTISSTATGLTCFRGQECYLATGSYTSVPNTSFFVTINSYASGSTCYRGQNCYIAGGAYSSSPNTSFFITISSLASGSTSYRGSSCNTAAGAYSSEPNTSFFYTINSFASGSGCYRGSSCNTAAGAYSSSPNTSFFITISSSATGSTAYRGEESHIAAGAYSSKPNTSFFITISSLASGSTSYRGESTNPAAGAYTSTPNTSFFYVINSLASGSTAYRGQESHIAAGAYSSHPNTSFFNTSHSIASGSTCYRGESCRVNAGAYVSSPNSQFFDVITSYATGITCYRNQNCALGRGAYSSYPNTSFFNTSHSIGSGSTCYRGESCRTNAGAYVSSPNTTFFDTVSSSATGKTCYRGVSCGSGRSTPNIGNINTTYFLTAVSKASGSTCYRATACNESNYWYSTKKDPYFSYKSTSSDYNGGSGVLTCHNPTGCNYYETTGCEVSGSITHGSQKCPTDNYCSNGYSTSRPSGTYFSTSSERCTDGTTCYYATGCASGYSSTYPNTAYFTITSSSSTDKTAGKGTLKCYAGSCKYINIDSNYFNTASSTWNGKTCSISTACRSAGCSFENTPYGYYSYTTTSNGGKTCNYVSGCAGNGSYNNSYADTTITASDGTSYKYGTVFTEKTTKGEGIACSSYANCYIGCSCNTSNGWYSTCQGSDCKSATDNHYTGVNSLSAGKSISDVASISASGANSGISAMAAANSGLKTASAAGNYTATAASAGLKTASAAATAGTTSGISTMASGATTCYKKKTCSEGGYFDSVPADQKCSSKSYNGYSCYTGCS